MLKDEENITVGELNRLIHYRDNLLIYIHNHLGLVIHNRDQMLSLVKEHKRITNLINNISNV
ncbi:hypothetical protein T190607A02C_70162 [Tenacibaculum sp. 190524A02b]